MSNTSDQITVTVEPHPLLDVHVSLTVFNKPLGRAETAPELLSLLNQEAEAPFKSSDEVRASVRDLLRHGGFKPTGRSKPASEYLLKATAQGTLSSINLAVDVCNIVSLHSGLPISVVDADLLTPPLSIKIAEPGSNYVFNPAGQTIDVGGLLCLFDNQGPSANAVKDAQRSKTTSETLRTIWIIWGTNALPGRAGQAEAWRRELLGETARHVTLKGSVG